jgi:hypothetical protein
MRGSWTDLPALLRFDAPCGFHMSGDFFIRSEICGLSLCWHSALLEVRRWNCPGVATCKCGRIDIAMRINAWPSSDNNQIRHVETMSDKADVKNEIRTTPDAGMLALISRGTSETEIRRQLGLDLIAAARNSPYIREKIPARICTK